VKKSAAEWARRHPGALFFTGSVLLCAQFWYVTRVAEFYPAIVLPAGASMVRTGHQVPSTRWLAAAICRDGTRVDLEVATLLSTVPDQYRPSIMESGFGLFRVAHGAVADEARAWLREHALGRRPVRWSRSTSPAPAARPASVRRGWSRSRSGAWRSSDVGDVGRELARPALRSPAVRRLPPLRGRAGLYRIAFAGFSLFVGGVRSYRWIAGLPQTFFHPPLGCRGCSPVSAGLVARSPRSRPERAVRLLLVGVQTRAVSIAISALLVLGNCFRYSLGKIDHDILFVLTPILFAGSWGAAFSHDALRAPERRRRRRSPACRSSPA
jgi:hypothetical protein